MIAEILAVVGGASTAGALIAVVVLALKLSTARDDERKALEDGNRASMDLYSMHAERDHFAELGVARAAQIADLERLLAMADKDAAKAVQDAVAAVVGHINASGIADAANLGNAILSKPWGRQS